MVRPRAWFCVKLIQLNPIADEPQLQLLQPGFSAGLERPHPFAVRSGIGHINHDLDEFVAIQHASMPPVAFDLLRFVAGSAKPIDDLQHCFGEMLWRHFAAFIELQRQENLEAPPLVARTSLCHAR